MVVTTSKGPMLDLFGPLKIKFSGEKRVLCQVSASCLENMSYRVCYTFMSFSKVITKKPWCGLLRGWIHHFPPLRIRWCLVHHHPMVGTWTSGSTCWKSCASSPKNSGIQGIHFCSNQDLLHAKNMGQGLHPSVVDQLSSWNKKSVSIVNSKEQKWRTSHTEFQHPKSAWALWSKIQLHGFTKHKVLLMVQKPSKASEMYETLLINGKMYFRMILLISTG